MSEQSRATDDPGRRRPRAQHPSTLTDDELADRITRALRSRESSGPDPAVVAARLQARLAERSAADGDDAPRSGVAALGRRSGRVAVAGVVTSVLAVGGAGAAAAANPYSEVARAVESVAQAVGIEWSAMPDGYTREQYEAFWDTHTVADMEALGALWSTDPIETKARAGQMILEGQPLPVTTPGTPDVTVRDGDDGSGEVDYTDEQYDALWGAGYTIEDVEALQELWGTGLVETKSRAGQWLLDGQTLPVAPGSHPSSETAPPASREPAAAPAPAP